MFRYRFTSRTVPTYREATYPSIAKVGELLFFGGGLPFRVLDVVPFEQDESPFLRLLQVEAA